MLCLLVGLNEHRIQMLPPCHLWTSSSTQSSKPMVLASTLLPRRPEWMCRGFPVSVINAFYKTIFWVSLSYQVSKLCLLGDLNKLRPCQCHWPIAFSRPPFKHKSTDSELDLQADALSPGRSEQICRCFPMSAMNALYKTIFWAYGINLSYVSKETWMNMERLSCISDECLLQDHVLSSLLYLLDELCLPGYLNNECGELRLPQCHQEIAIPRPSCH